MGELLTFMMRLHGSSIWDEIVPDTGKQVARIYIEKTGIDFHRRQDWGDFFQFMAKQMYKLESNFLSYFQHNKARFS